MVAEPLVHKVLSMATSSSTSSSSSRKVKLVVNAKGAAPEDGRVGILGPLSLGSHAVRVLVPGDDAWLLALALAEKLDALNRVTAVATRLGRRCTLPALLGFDHIYGDLTGRSHAFAVASPSEAATLVRKLDWVSAGGLPGWWNGEARESVGWGGASFSVNDMHDPDDFSLRNFNE